MWRIIITARVEIFWALTSTLSTLLAIKLAWGAQEQIVLVAGDVCLDANGLRIDVSQEMVEEGAEDRW